MIQLNSNTAMSTMTAFSPHALRRKGPSMMMLTDAIGRYLHVREQREGLSTLTIRDYRSTLNGFVRVVGDIPISTLSPEDVESWIRTLRQYAASTRSDYFSTVANFSAWLYRQGHTSADLFEGFRGPRRPDHVSRYIPSDDIALLLAHGCPDARARSIVITMDGMGLRCCEVSGLEMSDWDRAGGVMLIRHAKGGGQREVAVPSVTKAAIDCYLRDHPASAGPLFRSYRDRSRVSTCLPISANHLSTLVSRWMGTAGIKHGPRDGVSAHALRHRCATDVFEQSNDIRVVQEMLGHRRLSSTAIYLKRAGLAKMREAMEGREYRAAS